MKRIKERPVARAEKEPVRAYFSREGGTSQPRSPSEMLEPLRAPDPPRGKKVRGPRALGRTARTLNGALTLLLILMLGIGGAYLLIRNEFDKAGPLAHSTVIVIPKGSGMNAIAERLEREGIIADGRTFTAAVLYFRANSKLKAGEYEIRKGASMRQVLDTLVEGKTVLSKITVPEGYTSYQIVQILNKEPLLKGEITEIPAEGTLLPETYKFAPGSQRIEMIDRMREEHRRYVAKLWETRDSDLPYKTPEEAINLASLVEKETGKADERDRIAGVFLNRIRKKMRLQSDPTIIYHLTGGKGPLGRPILKSELQSTDNPYNTYRIDGLPPTPICNPGRAAIEAVLNPAATKDIYFVADGTGGHAFAETIRDHQNNVKKWRQIEKQMRVAEAEAKAGAGDEKELSAGPGVALESEELGGISVDNDPAAKASAETVSAEPVSVSEAVAADVVQANSGGNGEAAAVSDSEAAVEDAATSLTEASGGSVPLPARKPKL